MFFVQYVLESSTTLVTERYAALPVARIAFDSLTAICWAELVGPDGSVLAYREGRVEQPVHHMSAFREPE